MKSFEHGDEKLRYWGPGFFAPLTNTDIGALSMHAIQVLYLDGGIIKCIDMSFVILTSLLVFIVYKVK
ncbi:hypothetical protein [Bacillus cereus]|uniref:hypothetical protein n=1 Tax=Bacillus cereus TaxID=1396 RepID=UPI003D65F9A2